ncbi:MAG TPA: O-antigen ligase family protein, partial [Thermoanaerobaculia bacterium]|nr:O-antigen ligase family protein [Thermoanaerobaculia bacterium]
LDAVVIALGIAYIFPGSATILLGTLLLAVAASAWIGGEEIGLAATAYSVVALSILFSSTIDGDALLVFTGGGVVVSTVARVARRLRTEKIAREIAVAPPVEVPAVHLPFAVGLPLLVVVLYTNVSDVLIYRYGIPSMLQAVMLVLAAAVWRYRRLVRPQVALVHPAVVMLILAALVVFSTSIWAKDAGLVDHRLGEFVKCVIIAVVTASLAASWDALERALAALVAIAAALSFVSILQVATGRFFEIFGGLLRPQTGNIYGDLELPRASGPPVWDPNFYARILLIVIPVAACMALAQRRTSMRILYALAALVITGGTFATYSRGAMITVVIMGGLLLLAMRVPARYFVYAAIAGVVALIVLPSSLRQRLMSIEAVNEGGVDASVDKRKLLVKTGMAMFDDNLFFGVGGGHYGREYLKYANHVGYTELDFHKPGAIEHAHGFYVELGAETGLAGLFTVCGAFFAALYSAWRSYRALLVDGDTAHARIALSLAVAIAGYMFASLALHESYLRYMALYFGLVIGIERAVRGSNSFGHPLAEAHER